MTTARSAQKGISLLENLIALLVITIGLLGIAGLQVYTLKSGGMSANRMAAIQLANAMADKMRANSDAVYRPDGSLFPYDGVTPLSSLGLSAPDCSVSVCTADELAYYDIKGWADDLDATLPGQPGIKGGYISRETLLLGSGAPSVAAQTAVDIFNRSRYVITIHWDGDRTGAQGINCPPLSDSDMDCFKLEVDL